MKYRKKATQEVADACNAATVDVYHSALELHHRACASKCSVSIKQSAALLQAALELKSVGLDMDGCIPEKTDDGDEMLIEVQGGNT